MNRDLNIFQNQTTLDGFNIMAEFLLEFFSHPNNKKYIIIRLGKDKILTDW